MELRVVKKSYGIFLNLGEEKVRRSTYEIYETTPGKYHVWINDEDLSEKILSLCYENLSNINRLYIKVPEAYKKFHGFYCKEILIEEGKIYMKYILDKTRWIYPWSPLQQSMMMERLIMKNQYLKDTIYFDEGDSYGYEETTIFLHEMDNKETIWLKFFSILTNVEIIQDDIIERFTYNFNVSDEEFDELFKSLWVIESYEKAIQATAFCLEGVGVVTCEHAVFPDSEAFRRDNPNKRYKIRIIVSNKDIDVAIIEILNCNEVPFCLTRSTRLDLRLHKPVRVLGFPNHGRGDTGILTDGKIIGFRTRSTIKRFLTSCSIIGGNSGGPILDSRNQVVGIAATGADYFEEADKTEKHGGIPISAIDHLKF